MNRSLQRTWQRGLRRIGAPGLAAVGLLVLALVIGLGLPGLASRADALRSALAAQERLSARSASAQQRTPSRTELANEYTANFPPVSQSATDLRTLFSIAERRHLSLKKGEYQLVDEPNTRLVSYKVSLPVHDTYGTLKNFTADVLEALPHVSMEELRMSRTDPGEAALDAIVRFNFVYRSP